MAQNSFPVRQQLKRFPTNHRKYVVHQTASKMLAYGDTGSTHTNLGAAGGVTLTLPQNADKGVAFTFSVMAGQTLTIDPGAAGAIYIGGAKLADDASIASAEIGDTVTLECDGNHDWTVTAISGSWGQSEGAQILTDLDLGASGTAGSLDIFPTTASKGKVRFTATDNTNDDALTITNAAMGQASTLTIPDPGDSADEFVLKDKTQTLTGKTLTSPVLTTPQINDTSADHQYIVAVNELAADRTITLPILTGNDEVVFKDHAVTLTNKTLTSPAINTPLLGDGDAGLT
ncbi:MAG: hypothetical protein Q8P61_05955, partial [Candidatus Nanopelagicales bacterium]|nr:hypothetical protein [Candidatus Nanopelagicales bacterium]